MSVFRVDIGLLDQHDRAGLLAWVSDQLAQGHTVILHPGKANFADPSEVDGKPS